VAEPIGALRVELSANAAQFESDMNRARKAVRQSTGAMGRAFGEFRTNIQSVTSGLFSLRNAIAGLGVGLVLRNIIQTSAEFQRLQSSLKTVTGSVEAANAAFTMIKRFAATTPFDLQQVTGAFIKLKALGLDPSEAALQSYGNTASAMGKSLNDFIEAVADASTNEFERLKEFGIKAKQEGNKVSFTFQGVTTTVRKNAEEIQKYLRDIGDVQFAGAMEEQAKTLGGALSNLQDSFTVFQNEIGEGGFADAVADVAREMSAAAEGSKNLARDLGAALGQAVRGVAAAARFAAENIRGIAAAVTALIALKAATFFFALAGAVVQFTLATITAVRGMTLLNTVTSKSVLGAIAKLVIALGAGALVWQAFGKEALSAAEAVEQSATQLEAKLTVAPDTSGIQKLSTELFNTNLEMSLLIGTYKDGGAAVQELTDRFELSAAATKENIDLTTDAGQEWEAAFTQSQRLKRSLKDVEQVFEDTQTPLEKYNDEIARLNELKPHIGQERFALAVAAAKKELDESDESLKSQIDLVKDLGMTFTSSFEEAVIAGGKLSDVLQGLLDDITRILLRQLVLQPLLDAGSNFIGGLDFGSFFGGGAGVTTGTGTPGSGGASFAKGGDHRGGFRIVGENGPELEATGPSRIFSAEETADIMGGGGGDVTVNVYAPPGSKVEQRESDGPGGRQVDIVIDEAMAKAVNTPGSRTGRALQNRFDKLNPKLASR
jgi:hypothetical protein